jgi:PAS domain S-box-containing protein
LKIKDFLHLNYESQIRISLLFFILFLILLNFGTEYLFHQTKQTLEREIHQQLSTVAYSASLAWEKSPQSALKKNLSELSFKSGVNRISLFSSDGSPLVSSRKILVTEDIHIFWGMKAEVTNQIRGWDGEEKWGIVFSDLYTDSSGNTYLSCYLLMKSPLWLTDHKTASRIWVMVEKEVSAFAGIEKTSRLNAYARIVGLFIAALVTLILIKNLLRPYRAMLKKAQGEKIISELEEAKNEGETDAAVRIFEQVIKELKEKEKTLQKLYQKTDRKAKDLASYNEYILRSMTSGMVICNDQGEIVQINQPAEVILEFSRNVVIGKHYKTAFKEKSSLSLSIQTMLAEEKTFSIPEIKHTKRNGELVWLSINSSIIKDEQGRMLGMVVFLNDFTEVKKLEEEIAFKDKMAALGEMSSGLAHELRNSMGAILGFTKLLKKKKDDHSSKDQIIEGITKEAMSMESMLQRFLDFAKPLEPKIEEVDLGIIIQDCLMSVKEIMKEHQIALNFDSAPDLPLLLGDHLLLKQCFQNLIQNSIDAMPNGGELYIRLNEEKLSSQEKSMLVEISDTGCGIAKEDQDKIFNPFFTSKEKGTGLGLSLVKKIVSLHNGKIALESELNQGTTFKLHFPFKSSPNLARTKVEEKVENCPSLTPCQ